MQNFEVYLWDDTFIYDYDEGPQMELGDRFTISPTECCGWLCLSGFSYGAVPENYLKEFTQICEEMEVSFTDEWSETQQDPTKFTLFSVLTDVQKVPWEPHMKKLGWVELPSFFNPNTGNTCYPFMRPV